MASMLTQDERDKIAAAVAEVEKHTASELVTAVYSKSDSYASFRVGCAFGLALLLVGVAHLMQPSIPVMELLGTQMLIALAAYGITGLPAVLRIIVPRWAKEQAVHRKVRQLFLDLGVTETRDRSGVLIYLSELERRVEILGDRGIHEHLGKAAWQALVSELVVAIRGGSAADGLLRIIEQLGVELSRKFPIREGDTNELPNEVVTD